MSEIAINPSAALLGRTNAILTGRSRHYESMFAGPLSVKSVVSGVAVWETPAGRFELEPGAALVLNDGEEYTITVDALQPVETFCVFFVRGFVEDAYRSVLGSSVRLLDETAEDVSLPLGFAERVRYGGPLVEAVKRMRKAPVEESLYALAGELVRAECDVGARVARLPALRGSTRDELRRRVRRGVEFIHAHLASPLPLKAIASAACLSPFHFHRLFAALYGETPHRYIVRLRLERARSLLRSTERNVAEVAHGSGFESVGSFTALFRRRFGVPPGRFRKNG
ncbi:MAG TPA: AraC family transcriptional regulator, partial [Vicinamibacteria bacterium]